MNSKIIHGKTAILSNLISIFDKFTAYGTQKKTMTNFQQKLYVTSCESFNKCIVSKYV